MSRVVEVTIPSCDVEMMDALAYRRETDWEEVLRSALVVGLYALLTIGQPMTPDGIQRLCQMSHEVLGEALADVP